MIAAIKEFFGGAWGLLVGLGITAKYGFAKTVTVHYPFETIDITPNFRGHTDLIVDPETGINKCISCGMCEKACPSGCIEIKSEKPEGAKKKILVEYHLDFTKCSLCANCVEVCPVDALEFSHEYNLVGTSRHDFHFELVGRAVKKAAAMGITPKEPEPMVKPSAEAEKPAETV